MQKYIMKCAAQEEFGAVGLRGASCSQYLKGQHKSVTSTVLSRAMLTPLLDEDTTEYYLFHGTSWSIIDVLVKTGYDSRVARVSGMFGGGVLPSRVFIKEQPVHSVSEVRARCNILQLYLQMLRTRTRVG